MKKLKAYLGLPLTTLAAMNFIVRGKNNKATFNLQASEMDELSNNQIVKVKAGQAPVKATPSAHFGKRKTIVQAKKIEKYGETLIEVYKPMLLKSALKKNLTFKWN